MKKRRSLPSLGWNSQRGGLVGAIAVAASVTVSSAWAADATIRYRPEPVGRGTAVEECVVCHSIEANGPFRYAPNLYGIVGAEKAREREWFGYSSALMTMGGVWTEDDLDAYLEDAAKFAPGTTKTIKIQDPEERKAIIDFLKSQQS